MGRQVRSAVIAVVVSTVLLGLAYPLTITGIAQVLWAHQANGSQVQLDGRTVGSALIGQSFAAAAGDLQSRPSASGQDPAATAASNLGPNSRRLRDAISARASAYLRRERPYDPGLTVASVPADAVTASASGVDPDVSVANARIQAHRIAAVRHLPLAVVLRLIAQHTSRQAGGLFGPETVNVLAVNLALRAAGTR